MAIADTFGKLEAAIKKAKDLEKERDSTALVADQARKAHEFAVGEVNKLREELNDTLGGMFGSTKVRQS